MDSANKYQPGDRIRSADPALVGAWVRVLTCEMFPSLIGKMARIDEVFEVPGCGAMAVLHVPGWSSPVLMIAPNLMYCHGPADEPRPAGLRVGAWVRVLPSPLTCEERINGCVGQVVAVTGFVHVRIIGRCPHDCPLLDWLPWREELAFCHEGWLR